MRPFDSLRTAARGPLLQVVKTSIAAIVAWIISSVLLQQALPIFAAIAALLVVQPSVNQSLAKGIERSIGVILGVVLAYLAGLLFGNASWVVLSAIVVSLVLAWGLRLSPGSSNQIPISAMLVLAIGAQTPAYAADRIIETIIGAAIGLIVNVLIVPPILAAPAHGSVSRLVAAVADTLTRLALALSSPTDRPALDRMLDDARSLRPLQLAAARDLDAATDSLTLNPRGGIYRDSIEADRELLARLSILVTRAIGMARAVHDNYDNSLLGDPIVASISLELERAAHDVQLLGRDEKVGTSDELPPPALTAPLVIAEPDPRHWILVGSLMEDIRRVREEIVGGPGV